jgi:hypothetical protein
MRLLSKSKSVVLQAVCVRLAASFGSYKIRATVMALCCRHKQTDGRTDRQTDTQIGRHLQNIDSARNFRPFRDTEQVGETKMSFCVCYGQSNYPKVIFTKNLAAIKEHFTNFCCFQKKFSDAPHFGCNSRPPLPPVCKSSNLHPTWPHSNDFIALFSCKIQGKKCDLRHGAQFSFLPPATPHTNSLRFIIITVRHSS